MALESIDMDLAVNTKVPMEVDGEHLTPSELASVDLAEKEFAKHVQTLAAEANAMFEQDFGVKCTDAEHKDASHIMDIVSFIASFLIIIYYYHQIQPAKLASKVNHSTQLCEQLKHIICSFVSLTESQAR